MTIPADTSTTQYFYPNKIGRIILLAMEEVLTRNALNAILNLANRSYFVNNYPPNNLDKDFSFAELSAIFASMDTMYGPHSGRALGVRIGRAAFRYGVAEFGASLGVADLAFRLLPLGMKLKVGAEAFAEVFNQFSDQTVELEEEEELFRWHITRCPICWKRTANHPCGYLAVGALQEGLYWVSGGKSFTVEEVSCVAQGDEQGTIVIHKRPLD